VEMFNQQKTVELATGKHKPHCEHTVHGLVVVITAVRHNSVITQTYHTSHHDDDDGIVIPVIFQL